MQEKAGESQEKTGNPVETTLQKVPERRDSESKGEQGNVGKRKGNQAQPEKASDRFARGARSARLPGGTARES